MRTATSISSTLRNVRASSARFRRAVIRHSGLIALVAVIVFVSTCALMQWLRTDLTWWDAPLSYYLKGEYGEWVRAAYYGLSVALMLLGEGLYRALRPHARSVLPALLLWLAGIALAVTAITETDLPYLDHEMENQLHRVAALTTFLSVTTAMMLQSWHFRGDAAWRQYFGVAFPLAVASFIALAVYAFWRDAPEGLAQKTVIAMILLWLGFAARWLQREQLAAAQVTDDRP